LCDPQTSGGLLVACADDAVASALDVFRRHGFARAAVVGHVWEPVHGGPPQVIVDP
jgi:selenide,water dikinase